MSILLHRNNIFLLVFFMQAAGVRMNADDCNGRSYMSGKMFSNS